MSFDLKIIYDSLEKNYSKESLIHFTQQFHDEFSNISFNDTKYNRYIPILLFDFFNPQEFTGISKRILEETKNPNLNFNSLLFRLSLELNTDKTNYEKELIYSLTFNLIGKNSQEINDSVHYSIGFVAGQAANMGVDISSSLVIMQKILSKHAEYFEEGFIDGLSFEYPHLLANEKLFDLFAAKYDKWGKDSQAVLKKMYVDSFSMLEQKKISNPLNAQSFFWMTQFFSNESLLNYIHDFSKKAFQKEFDIPAANSDVEQNYFQLQQEMKIKQKEFQQVLNFVHVLSQHFEGLKEINPVADVSPTILNQILNNQKSYIQELEQYKVDNERSKKLKDGIKKVL